MNSQEVAVLVFTLDQQCFALPCSFIKRIINMVEISELPNAPTDILGVINLHGEIIPVINISKRLGLKQQQTTSIHDYIIIIDFAEQTFCFIANEINFLEININNIELMNDIINGVEGITKIIKNESEIIHILDVDFLFDEKISKILPNKKKAIQG